MEEAHNVDVRYTTEVFVENQEFVEKNYLSISYIEKFSLYIRMLGDNSCKRMENG